LVDGDYSTGATAPNEGTFTSSYAIINYTPPINYDMENTRIRVKDGYGDRYETIPVACWDDVDTYGFLRIIAYSRRHSSGNPTYEAAGWYCMNGYTDSLCNNKETIFYRNQIGQEIYEEAINWSIDEVKIKNNYTNPSEVKFGKNFNYTVNLSIIPSLEVIYVNFSLYKENKFTYAYDEDGDEHSVINQTDNSSFYINYTKPSESVYNSMIQIKHASGCSIDITENITIPLECWNFADKIALRHKGYNKNNMSCYNGSSWIDLGLTVTSCASTGSVSVLNSTNGSELYDGDWNTYASYQVDDISLQHDWWSYVRGSDRKYIYETAMWWAYDTYLYNDTNATKLNDLYTSRNFLLNESGNYTVEYDILLNDTVTYNYSSSFEVIDYIDITPLHHIQSKQPGDYYNFSIDINTNSENLTYNLTYNLGLGSNISISPNSTELDVTANRSVTFRVNISSNITDGIYNGTINVTREFDNYSELIYINLSVSLLSGDISLYDDSARALSMYNDESDSLSLIINNTGNGNLTNVTCELTGIYRGFSFWSFNVINNISINNSDTITLSIINPIEGSYSDYIDCYGISTRFGGLDYLDNDKRALINIVSSSRTTIESGGGGSSSDSSLCGLELYRPRAGTNIQMYAAVGKKTNAQEFTIRNNGKDRGTYLFSVIDNSYLESHCEIQNMSVVIEPNLLFTNKIHCIVDEEPQQGTLQIQACGEKGSYTLTVKSNFILEQFNNNPIIFVISTISIIGIMVLFVSTLGGKLIKAI